MKNAFHSKLFSFLKYLIFCRDFFGHMGKQLDKKANIISEFVTSQPG